MKILKKIKHSIVNSAGPVAGRAKTAIKAIPKRIESLTAVAAILFIWTGTRGYDKRLALITVGVILIADIWFDKFLKRKNK